MTLIATFTKIKLWQNKERQLLRLMLRPWSSNEWVSIT